MNKVTVVVTFLQGETLTFTDKPFLEVIQTTFSEQHEALVPIKILFQKTEKVLYADKNIFSSLINDDISTEDAIAATQCDALVRNVYELYFDENGTTIFQNSLWKKIANKCILVDDDDFASFDWHETQFKTV